jgi:hypothetical protein
MTMITSLGPVPILPVRGLVMFMLLCLVAVLVGCKPVTPMTNVGASASSAHANHAADANSSVMSDSVNYMHDRGVKYTLYDLSTTPPTAIGGSIVDMLGTGGEKGCCLSLPKTWRPGIKLRLVWDEADRQQTYPEKYTRDFEVPKYDEPADLYVVFYPKNEVEIVVSKGEPGHPDWKGRVKETPWESCLAHHDRKVCKAALPVYGGLSWDEMQGYCTYIKEEKEDMQNCDVALIQCIRNYEDEERCNKALFGERKK